MISNKRLLAICQSFLLALGLFWEFKMAIQVSTQLAEQEVQEVMKTYTTTQDQHQYPSEYVPSSSEKFVVDHATELNYTSENDPSGCGIWNSTNELSSNLLDYQSDLDNHTDAIQEFKAIPDLMKSIIKSSKGIDGYTNIDRDDICAAARPHPGGLKALFPSNQLSFTRLSGYVEPLLPPMRDSKVCTGKYTDKEKFMKRLMSLDYLVHDFEHMCRQLKPTSKRIFIDMGASLSFHLKENIPVLELLNLYEKFGFHFDHIYGFEIAFTEPETVYGEQIPEKYFANYHWINVGVNHTEGDKLNPLHSILSKFDEDDFIVVKLDIDTSSIEVPLAYQLLEGGKDGLYHKLVDQFYFEHHIHMKELAKNWKLTMKGSIKDSLDLFYGLREKGISAHFWP